MCIQSTLFKQGVELGVAKVSTNKVKINIVMHQRYTVLDPQDEPAIETYCDLHSIHYYWGITGMGVQMIVTIDTQEPGWLQFVELWDFALDLMPRDPLY